MSHRVLSKPAVLMVDLANGAAGAGLLGLTKRLPPGAMIERLPEEKRALLRQLTSDEIADLGKPAAGGDLWVQTSDGAKRRNRRGR